MWVTRTSLVFVSVVTKICKYLQSLVGELREGLHVALMELSELRQRDNGQEEKLQAHLTEVDDKIMGLKNSLNTFKEELNVALFHIKDISSRQREVQKTIEHLQLENSKDIISVQHRMILCADKRQRVALELLESERVYVSHLSLLLKANISFNGSEAFSCKDKRPFPSSLRFLIQQHLELLHTLQERVLKCQWQSIVGDVFMRLTSKESDFLDFYVSYLREIPECLSVISMLASGSVPSPAFVEVTQITLSLPRTLGLQGLLKQTEADHPDYYLLLVCIQQLRSFTAQYHHLLQHNQELLLHNHKEVKRSALILSNKLNASTLARDIDCDWYYRSSIKHLQPFNQSPHVWLPGLGSIPESEASERSCQHQLPFRPENVRQVQPGSALADALEEFLLPPDPAEIENLYDEEIGIYHDVAMFDRCSSSSSDSSIDIAFVKCPKAPSASPHARNKSTACEVFANSRSQGKGSSRLHNRGCVSPDESIMMRRNQHRPLQASQRKSKVSFVFMSTVGKTDDYDGNLRSASSLLCSH
uniref:DH domain-containing protein n=1 Tax=Takifugu rubripes TaxID=31033 RepID=A0A674P5H2_TAKRU